MRRHSVCFAATVFATSVVSCIGVSAGAGEAIKGERIDPAHFGPAVIETMADAMARAARAPAGAVIDSRGRNGRQGTWVVPSVRGTYFPHSGSKNVVNKWGDTRMGIAFPDVVDVHEAYFSGQAGGGVWTTGVRVIGYRAGREVGRTDWLGGIGREAKRLAIGLSAVDRIVVESKAVLNGGGWYGMDDLTFTVRTDRVGGNDRRRVIDFDDVPHHTTLMETGYAGLTWEMGTGDFDANKGIHAPQVPPGIQEDEAQVIPEPEGGAGGEGTLPLLEMDFQGSIRGNAGSFSFPPDTHGAVGVHHYVETVNRIFEVFDKETGGLVLSMHLSTFLPGSNGDPRVLYDQHHDRWVVIVSDFTARTYLAYSLTDDPLGAWFKTSFIVSQGADEGLWPDYPTLGVDANGIYSAAFMVGTGSRMSIFAIDKAPLLEPAPSLGTVTAFRGLPWEGAIQPAHTWGDPGGEYFVSRRGTTEIRVRRLDPPMTDPVLNELGFLTVPPFVTADDAPALGSVTPLDTVGTRLMNAMYRDGSVWTAHTVRVDGRASCRWYQISPEPLELTQVGTVSDPVRWYFFPSIAVNQFGHAVMGFTGSSAQQYAASYYTGRRAMDPPGAMAPPALLRAGSGAQNNIDGVGRNRWGDYSQTAPDPVDLDRIWTIQEYGHATNIWGTWIGALSAGDCNNNGVLDECDIACDSPAADCDPMECGRVGDCNANGSPDDCDIALLASFDFNNDGAPDECPVLGDFDGDRDIDLTDYAGFVACSVAGDGGVPDDCTPLDFDADGDLDLMDFRGLQSAFTGDCGVVIAEHPANTAVCPFAAAEFSITAAADQLTYHWSHNGVEIADANGATLTVNPVTDAQAGFYTAYAVSGCAVATSSQATLELLAPPVVTGPPQDNATCIGSQASFSVVAAGVEPLVYQWQFNGLNVPGETGAAFVVDSVTVDDVGGYRSVVTDDCGQSTTSPSATLSLQPNIEIIEQPMGATYCVGESAFLFVNATGFPNYQWFKDGDPIEGANAPFLAFVTTSPDDSGSYHAVAGNDCFEDTSAVAAVNVVNCP